MGRCLTPSWLRPGRIEEIVRAFPSKRIAVAGDFFLDRIFIIDRSLDEPSVETGLTAYQVKSRKLLPGAAGVATNNLSAFGAAAIYSLALTGDDGESYDLIKGLRASNVNTEYMVKSEDIFTPTYTKTMFDLPSGLEETHRIDIKNRKPTPVSAEKQMILNLYRVAENIDALIVLEQLKDGSCGTFTKKVKKALSDLAVQRPGLIIMADSRFNIAGFSGLTVKCNDLEAVRAVYPEIRLLPGQEIDDGLIDGAMESIARRTGKDVFVSCGAKGIKVRDAEGIETVPGYRVEGPIDICGAGDSATTGIACALCAGATVREAALIGNLVASITIQQIGVTGTATIPQILKRFREYMGMFD
jgi:bifunctional ADP-heptose synthase (sugar kinase/adenylyltransferase)